MSVNSLVFSHFGIHVTDLDMMADFYKGLLGFIETDRGAINTPDGPRSLVFLSKDPDEHHQLVLMAGRPEHVPFNVVNQISFRTQSLEELLGHYQRLAEYRVSEITPVTHGNALSVYFRDPEGNRIELFFATPWYVTQPCRHAAPFDLPADELLVWAEKHARQLPGFESREAWRARMVDRLNPA